MKTKIIISIIITFFIGFSLPTNAQSNSKYDQVSVQVDGLGCPFCAYGLEKKMKELKGIKNIEIKMETGMLSFNFPTEKKLTVAQIEKQVDVAGYTPIQVTIKRTDGTVAKSEVVTSQTIAKEKEVESQFFVAGNCEMCKARIEKAAKSVTTGVANAVWDVDTKQINVKFDKSQIAEKDIVKAIAKAGHDTKSVKADTKTYDNLPACCLYKREN